MTPVNKVPLVGFIGAGGAGLMVAILTTVFDVPVHTAIGTAILAMLFVTFSGAVSHFRQGNVAYRLGLVVGLAGAAGAVVGADTSQAVPERAQAIAAGVALWLLALLVWIRTKMNYPVTTERLDHRDPEPRRPVQEWVAGLGLDATGGAAAAFFGVGMAPYLQLGFLTLHKLTLRQTVGTTMWTLVFISAAGGIAMAWHGDVALPHLIGLTVGLSSGAYVGARFTGRAPHQVLRTSVVIVPVIAGAMLLFL